MQGVSRCPLDETLICSHTQWYRLCCSDMTFVVVPGSNNNLLPVLWTREAGYLTCIALLPSSDSTSFDVILGILKDAKDIS